MVGGQCWWIRCFHEGSHEVDGPRYIDGRGAADTAQWRDLPIGGDSSGRVASFKACSAALQRQQHAAQHCSSSCAEQQHAQTHALTAAGVSVSVRVCTSACAVCATAFVCACTCARVCVYKRTHSSRVWRGLLGARRPGHHIGSSSSSSSSCSGRSSRSCPRSAPPPDRSTQSEH
jgi:hypothetical protein